jgi:hypothetical protein
VRQQAPHGAGCQRQNRTATSSPRLGRAPGLCKNNCPGFGERASKRCRRRVMRAHWTDKGVRPGREAPQCHRAGQDCGRPHSNRACATDMPLRASSESLTCAALKEKFSNFRKNATAQQKALQVLIWTSLPQRVVGPWCQRTEWPSIGAILDTGLGALRCRLFVELLPSCPGFSCCSDLSFDFSSVCCVLSFCSRTVLRRDRAVVVKEPRRKYMT